MPHTGSSSLPRLLAHAGLALGLAVAGQAVFLAPASASTTLTVTTTADISADDGACGDAQITTAPSPLSLREATCLANNIGGTVLINVPAGSYNLTSGELKLGDEPDQDTTIVGDGTRSTIIDAGGLSRVLELDFNLTGGVNTSISGLTITGGSDDTFGGAGILAGSGNSDVADSLTISNSTITDNHANTGGSTSTSLPGGGVQFVGGSLTIVNSTISDNSSGNSSGSGVYYQGQGTAGGEQLTVTGSTFSGNSAVANVSGVINGGALSVTAAGGTGYTVSNSRFLNNTVVGSGAGIGRGAGILAQSGSLTVTGSTFTGNSVTGGTGPAGGAVAVDGGSAVLHYNRFTGNSAASGSAVSQGGATVNATDNWWGCNTGPGTAGCDSVAGSPTVSPRLVLTASASPATVVGPNAPATITATLTQNSLGSAIGGANLGAFAGLSVRWSDPQPSGAVLAASSSALSSGSASTSYNSQASSGPGHVLASLDNGTATAAITVNRSPAITSGNTATFTAGTAGSFTVTATGTPTPSIVKTGTLPSGLSFVDNGNGTASISGTPAAGSGGAYSLNLTASNGVSPNGTQTLTVNVNQAPAVTTNPSNQSVNPGASVSFTAAASGFPNPSVQWQRSTDGGGSFANIAGATSPTYTFTVAAGDNGNQYRAVFTNTVGSATSTAATLTVGSAPTISSANTTAFTVGAAGSFTVTTSGFPNPTLTTTGTLPGWLSFTDNGDGTATLAGTPPAGSGGAYSFTINADNGNAPSDSQAFTLTVNESPTITSADHATFQAGAAGNFLVTTAAGFPVSTTLSKTGSLPSGVTFTDNGNGTATLGGTPAAGAAGSYPITITATNGASPAATQSFTLTVIESPVITSADHATFTVGSAGSFTVTTSPAASAITKSGTLPSGVTFTDNGDGTATIAGTPAAGTGGTYPLTLTASDGVTPDTTQSFTLTVNQPPVITSADHDSFSLGAAGSFTVTTAPGVPSATTITKTGSLPAGVSFTDNGDGTATIAGTPTAAGTFAITIKASNGVAPDGTQVFTLTVNQAPDITSADHTTFTAGTAGSFTVTTSPAADTITETGALPAGVTFTDNGDGTGTLAGAPAAGTGGVYNLSVKATNATGFSTQTFTLTLNQPPVITSADHATFQDGIANSYLVTISTGYPVATTITKTGSLPAGVTFTDNGDGTATLAGTPAAGTDGSYPLTITATNAAGSRQQSFTLTVVPANASPVITSADHATFGYGTAGSFTVTTTAGYPTATTITKTGALPAGVSFTDNGDGTATIAGTPAAGTGGVYNLTLTATNATGSSTQSFTLMVYELAAFTSADHTTFAIGAAGSFTVTTTAGYPVPTTLTKTGSLPAGVSFTDNGDGTATLAGTPAAGTTGSYPLTLTATNAAGSRQQSFTLTVQPANAPPVITSAARAAFAKGSAGSFTVTTTAGYPTATTITKTGALPAGVSFTDNHDGTATIAGTPTAAGSFPITIKASNGASTDATQSFTLTVNAPPTITSANTATFTSGNPGSFTVTTAAGYPTATTLTETGALPAGVMFTDNHNGTATIAGTPSVPASTNYTLTIKASNGIAPDASQTFTLKVTTAPPITRSASATSAPQSSGLLLTVSWRSSAGRALTASLV